MRERLGKKGIVNRGADYGGIDETEDGAIIDKIISGIDPKPHHAVDDVRVLARGALFFLDKDPSAESVRSSIRQHPSAQNVPIEKLTNIAGTIIQAYQEEVEALVRHKRAINPSKINHDVLVAVIRNLEQLDNKDLERIAEVLGYHKDYFKLKK